MTSPTNEHDPHDSDRGDDDLALGGGAHLPVMVPEVLAHLLPAPAGAGAEAEAGPAAERAPIYCDGTVGLGGHATAILDAAGPSSRLVGLDRDPDAIAAAGVALARFGDRVTLVHTPFSRAREVLDGLGVLPIDGFLVDLGVSSPQLDRAERGFSFLRSGPLDMRMDPTRGETAADLLARVDEAELARILRDYGEERFAGRIARHIVEARDRGELDSTGTLAAIVARAVPQRGRGKNPATRTFQALRIAVNRELGELDTFLDQAATCLRPGGRLVVIAFHSLEDRIVKRRFRAWATPERERGRAYEHGHGHGQPQPQATATATTTATRFRILTKRPLVASDEEQARNPRARSAKLRAVERVA